MNIVKNPNALNIILFVTEYPDYSDLPLYISVLTKYGYIKESIELEQINEGDFYEMVQDFVNEFSPDHIH